VVSDERYDKLLAAAQRHQAGDLNAAAALYREVLSDFPDDPDAHHNLGVLIMQGGGQPGAALPHFRAAWKNNPATAQNGLSLMRALVLSDQREAAVAVHAEGRQRGHAWPPMHVLFPPPVQRTTAAAQGAAASSQLARPAAEAVNALQQAATRGDHRGGQQLARQFIQRYPQHPFGWKVLGTLAWQAGNPDAAVAPLEQAVRFGPADPEAQLYLGQALMALHLPAKAELPLRTAATLAPERADALLAWGRALYALNRFSECEQVLRRAVAIGQHDAEAHLVLALTLQALDQDAAALASLRTAQSLAAVDTDIAARLGAALIKDSRFIEAERAILATLAQVGTDEKLELLLIDTLASQGRLAEVAARQRAKLQRARDDIVGHSGLLFYANYLAEATPATRLASARDWGNRVQATVPAPFADWNCEATPKRLRVGLVSGDLRSHPVGYFLENVLAASTDTAIDYIAYPTITEMDAVSVQLRSHLSDWCPLVELSDADAAARIRADGIHILVDLAGHTGLNRLPVFAWRPAPIQVSWLGYFATTGLPTIDYFIADEVGAPRELHDQFVEKIAYLPDTRLCFSPPADAGPVATLPALTRGYVTFATFQNMAKINASVLAAWSAILLAVPTARLRMQNKSLDDPELRAAMPERLQAAGIDPMRVDLVGSMPRANYLRAHDDIDIILDTFPYPGGTTTCEALWMGVPTLTLCGDTLLARQGASLLHAARLDSWIAATPDDYVRLATQWSRQPEALAALRMGLREQVGNSPLFDGARFAKTLARTWHSLWQQWQETGPPGEDNGSTRESR